MRRGWLPGAAIPVAALALAADAGAMTPSAACAAGEQRLFQCVSGERTMSLCADRARDVVRYRVAAPGQSFEHVLSTDQVRLGVTAYAGGGEARIRFNDGATEYIAFDRSVRTGFDPDGDNDPEMSAGVVVNEAGGETTTLECDNNASILAPAYEMLERDDSTDRP
ncbi:MAG TPA: hypothetical protein PLF73_00515 [Luteimonas sp.]|nr:hypothetical protein [Luteimonas sp.]